MTECSLVHDWVFQIMQTAVKYGIEYFMYGTVKTGYVIVSSRLLHSAVWYVTGSYRLPHNAVWYVMCPLVYSNMQSGT
jgi:hypothetical protein